MRTTAMRHGPRSAHHVLKRATMALAVLTATTTAVVPALAEPSAELNHFTPAELANDGFVLRSAETPGHLKLGAQLYVDYANDPLVFEQDRNGQTSTVRLVQHQITGHLNLSLGITEHFVAFVGAPVLLRQRGQGIPASLSPGVVDGEGNSTMGLPIYAADGAGLGDVFVGGRARLLGTTEDLFILGLSARIGLPTAKWADDKQNYRGENSVSGWPELLGQLNLGRVRLLANAGVLLRDKADACADLNPPGRGAGSNCFTGTSVGHELTYAVGGHARLLDNADLRALVEMQGRAALTGDTSSLEVLAGLKYLSPAGVAIGLGGGPGIVQGYGTPDFRVFGTLAYGPGTRITPADADGDGIPDDADQCPNEAEDVDQFEDEDGCPDLDNDHDGIPDSKDQCQLAAEDMDGFEDEDGCAEPDNDGDGILDVDDKCPTEAEDADGFEDEDGCPELDNDQDGIADADDKCPLEAGVAEKQGCPIQDRDGDGVPDAEDSCVNEAGPAETNGCPKKATVVVNKDRLELTEKVYFKTSSDEIEARSFELLDDVARVLSEHPEVKHVLVEGHTDSTGPAAYNKKLSQKRAAAVKAYLVEHGVEESRLSSEGFGSEHPLEANAKAAWQHAKNRRVEFTIQDAPASAEGSDDGGEQ